MDNYSINAGVGLFTMILLVSSNYSESTLSCDTMRLYSNNDFMKHLLGYLAIIIFINNSTKYKPVSVLLYSALFYAIMKAVSLSGAHVNYVFMIAVFFTYIFEMFRQNYEKEKNTEAEKNTKQYQSTMIGIFAGIIILIMLSNLIERSLKDRNFNINDYVFENLKGCSLR